MTAVRTSVDRSPSPEKPSPSAPDWTTTCLNCGAGLTGPFCAECGQRAAPPHPTLRELGGEAFAELSGWDGKVAETMRALLRKPGKLTREFLEGRRSRYVSPLRLYLTCSVIYFLIAASAPPRSRSSIVVSPGAAVGSGQARNIADAQKGSNVTDEDRREIERMVNKAPRIIRPLLHRVSNDSEGLQAQMLGAMPKALFALLPVFAGILMIFFRKRHFSEHLYFAFHLHAFIFVAISFSTAVRYLNWQTAEIVAGIVVLLWIPIYAHLSFKRVYGESTAKTIAKEIGIGALYVAASLPAMVLLAIWVASH
jgi:hypothetical protein